VHARVTTTEIDPARVDEAVAEVEEQFLPTWRDIDGFKGFTLLIDRSSGKMVGTSYWVTQEHMQASEDAFVESNQRTADIGGATNPPQVERFEVALDTFVK
jgi:heme-degrading monooxygenase HmoA